MQEDTRKKLKKRLNDVNEKISDKEDKVRNWRAVCFVGLVGMCAGTLSLHQGREIAGGIIAIGGAIFKAINNFSLIDYEMEKYDLEYDLEHPDNVMEYDLDEDENDKGGKHFRK